ncbi:dihydroorotase [bacterium BMS3Abin15]|nr:dihydroorotase [bacterium BMS3Abin15]HDZ85097.1 hypothetical protein [Candidatus Moranbacteria bacterium]
MSKNTIKLPRVIINTHCHGRDLREAHKTTVKQYLKESLKSSISISILMPNTNPPIVNILTLNKYLSLINRAVMEQEAPHEQYIYFGLTDTNIKECEIALRYPMVVGLKIYPKGVTTGNIGVSDYEVILKAMELVKKNNKVLAVHCDDPGIIAAARANPIEAEVFYVKKIIGLAAKTPRVKIVICHVSCQQSVEIILNAQGKGMQIAIEVTPHHLWFDSDGTNWNPAISPIFYHCYNNLRSIQHRVYLQHLITKENSLVFIGSDSACHTEEEKMANKKLGGIPTHQEMVPVIVTLAKQFRISDRQVANLLSFNASKFLGIPVSDELVEYEIKERIDSLQYNDGKVLNPWNGSRLWFPVLK